MSFDWKDYVYLAEELLNRTEESCYRSSISRAYYGVFCITRNLKGYGNYKPKKGENIHWVVINAYKNSSDRREKISGESLINSENQETTQIMTRADQLTGISLNGWQLMPSRF